MNFILKYIFKTLTEQAFLPIHETLNSSFRGFCLSPNIEHESIYFPMRSSFLNSLLYNINEFVNSGLRLSIPK